MFTLQTSFRLLLLKGRGVKSVVEEIVNSKGGKLFLLLSQLTSQNSASVLLEHEAINTFDILDYEDKKCDE
jgi:hypothetical protein